jgi:hypothetical protein
VIGLDAIAYSTVNKYLRQRYMSDIPIKNLEEALITIIDDAILDALQ